MIIQWTKIITTDFNLDQAQEDFNFISELHPNEDPEQIICDAVNANFSVDDEEYSDILPGFEIAVQALRKRIGGVQLRMELD